jgi:N-terminal domain of reverse transcriptase
MNVEQSMCATSGPEAQWDRIDWSQCELKVRRLQERIVKATQEGRHGKVKALQWLLTHSFYGRALAVKRVTQSGQKHAGSGRSYLEHTGVQIQGHRHTATARVSTATAAARLYPEGQRKAETARHPHDEGSCYAGPILAGASSNRGDYGRSQLLWFSTGTLNR